MAYRDYCPRCNSHSCDHVMPQTSSKIRLAEDLARREMMAAQNAMMMTMGAGGACGSPNITLSVGLSMADIQHGMSIQSHEPDKSKKLLLLRRVT